MTWKRRVVVALGISVVTGIAGPDQARLTNIGRTPWSPLLAQEAASPTQGLVRKGKVPVSNDILNIKLPRPSEAVLSNGLRMLVLEDHRLQEVSFQLLIPGAGGYFDPGDLPGLASFTATLMREGTATRSSNQISQELEIIRSGSQLPRHLPVSLKDGIRRSHRCRAGRGRRVSVLARNCGRKQAVQRKPSV